MWDKRNIQVLNMKLGILQIIFFIQYACLLHADGLQSLPVKKTNFSDVQQKLKAFENGTMSLDDVTISSSSDWCKKVVAYYFSHTNEVSIKMKLPISRCFAILSDYPEAARLSSEYVNTYSNDYRGWRILGGAELQMSSYNEAIVAMTNAMRLGDKENYDGLGIAALAAHRTDILRDIVVPHLLVLKDDEKRFSKKERLEMRQVLVAYSLDTDKKNVFVKALEGVDVNDILLQADLKNFVTLGCERFKGKDIDKIREELKAAEASDSITNAPSP
jgi:hypothetical protein